MKIFLYVGSNNKGSLGTKIAEQISYQLSQKEHVVKIYKAISNPLELCKGCLNCFRKGVCPLDTKDKMDTIKYEMKKSDIIIWISPVYVNNISGTMKNYIDRLAFWTHTMELAGKLGVVISVTDNSGHIFVNYYMSKILEYMGCDVIGEYTYSQNEKTDMSILINDVVEKITESINNNIIYVSNERYENRFVEFKKFFLDSNYEKLEKGYSYEIDYWNELGIENCKSFQEILDKKRDKNNESELVEKEDN